MECCSKGPTDFVTINLFIELKNKFKINKYAHIITLVIILVFRGIINGNHVGTHKTDIMGGLKDETFALQLKLQTLCGIF